MAGRLPDTRQVRVVTARRGEFGDLDEERESLETKDGERESMETKDGDRESLETQGGERESLETSRARQECRVQKRITGLHRTLDSPVNLGPGEECHISAVERHTGVPPASRESAERQQGAEHRLDAVREGQVGQPGGTDFGPGVERFSGPCEIGK